MTKAVLKDDGKTPSANERLTIVVIGISSASRQDLISLVGIESSGQEAFEDESMACLTSSRVAGEKLERGGGGDGAGG